MGDLSSYLTLCVIFTSCWMELQTIIQTCDPVNCNAGEGCLGHCYERRNKIYCNGQCVPKRNNTAGCVDKYERCPSWSHLCSNSVVLEVCRKTCELCDEIDPLEECRGFICDNTCVPLTYLCDGASDCRDGSDERDCKYMADKWYYPDKTRRCGIRTNHKRSTSTRSKRLVNSRYSQGHSWPWTGVLLSSSDQMTGHKQSFCGVTLIHKDWAITAAHCVTTNGSSKRAEFVVSFGRHYLRVNAMEKKTMQVRNVSKMLYFLKYDENDIYFDVALLKLNASVELNEFVNIACMPSREDVLQFYKEGGVTTGWGYDEEGKMASRLKQTLTKPMDKAKCSREVFRIPHFSIDSSLICTELDQRNGFGVICDGDSGGPMVVRRRSGSYAMVGVASFGTDEDCSKPGEAAVFTSVYYYLPWIQHHVDVTFA